MDDTTAKGRSRGMTRRAIVGGAGALAGTAVCAGREPRADERQQTASAEDDPRVVTYRETDHIRWFYRRARM